MLALATAIAPAVARRLRREDGQALTEYALILFLVAIVSLAVLWALGVDVATALDTVENAITGGSGTVTPGPAPSGATRP